MQVAIVGRDPTIFQPVARALEDDGVSVTNFTDQAELQADLAAGAARLAPCTVLYGPGWMPVGRRLLQAAPDLLALVSPFTGVEGFDREAAAERGVLIANGQVAENYESMAEATVMLLLACAYALPQTLGAMKDGAWPRPTARGRMVKAMTVGIVGFGRIGQALAARLQPFGCRLLAYVRTPPASPLPGVEFLSLERLAQQSDAVLLAVPLTSQTRHLVDRRLISLMRDDAILVNTARGGLIDEEALIEAAQGGKFAWMALDVFEQEPLPPDSPLRGLPRTLLTPHSVGHTRETIRRLPQQALESIRSVLRGEPPAILVNPEALGAWWARNPGEPA